MGATFAMGKLWSGRDILKVYFMDEDLVNQWRVRNESLSIALILEWANLWKYRCDTVPRFIWERTDIMKSDIRVKFSGNNIIQFKNNI